MKQIIRTLTGSRPETAENKTCRPAKFTWSSLAPLKKTSSAMEAGDSEEHGLVSVGALGCCTPRRPPGCVHGLHSDAGRRKTTRHNGRKTR